MPAGTRKPLALIAAASFALAACGGEPPRSDPTGVDELAVPTPTLDAADFIERIDNPWLPLVPGSQWVYRATSEDGVERVTVTVLEQTREIGGVAATVVHDVVTDPRGRVVEDTFDWFAQDREGNVWYLGEATREFDPPGSKTGSTEGSWEAGVDGARAGIAMLAAPRAGDGYKMEHLEGEAEDQAKVIELDAALTTGPNKQKGLLLTEDTTPLEPDLVEHKWYAEGVGLVHEETVEGGDEVVELVRFTPPKTG